MNNNSQEALIIALKEFNKITSENISIDKPQAVSVPLQEISKALRSVVNEFSSSIFNDKMLDFFEEIRADEDLSIEEFEQKYSETIRIREELGSSGWVVSEHANPEVIGEWYSLVRQN